MGLFWDTSSKHKRVKPFPPIPNNGWKPPRDLPNLSGAAAISVDTETYDPGLTTRGPGWARGEGHIVGVSLGTDDGYRGYFPIRHQIDVSQNLNPKKVFAWLNDILSTKCPKVGANLIYDIGWLEEEGVTVNGPLYDVQYAEALLSEDGLVNLDHLGNKYLNEGKSSNDLYRWCSEAYGGQPNGKQRANIYRTPPSLTGPYAESDVDLPFRVLRKQKIELDRQNLWQIFRDENELIRLLIAMRQRGVRVDIKQAEIVSADLKKQIAQKQKNVNWLAGQQVEIYKASSLAKAFDTLGLRYPHTQAAKPRPSFTKPFLESCPHIIAKEIVGLKAMTQLRNDFVEKAILEHHVNGRIHCQFHPLRTDSNGARSGRFAASDPNLQQIPSRNKILAPKVRGLFVPDEGCVDWIKQDQSQVEYRFLANDARGPSGKKIRRLYADNPKTNYHHMTHDLVLEQTGKDIEHKPIKSINFGIVYGMQVYRLSKELKIDVKAAKELLDAYHRGAPFVKATMDWFSSMAQDKGYVTTISGRRSRFDTWEPINWRDYRDRPIPLPYDSAIKKYGGYIQRANTYRALNRRLQGNAADLLKAGMRQCYRDGYFDEVGVPVLTVHDELDFPNPGGKDKIFEEIKHVCETAIKLRVPVIVDEERGPNWGAVR